ncbi:MAG: hypothetical protein ACRDNS_21760 [Trebonia sp.]
MHAAPQEVDVNIGGTHAGPPRRGCRRVLSWTGVVALTAFGVLLLAGAAWEGDLATTHASSTADTSATGQDPGDGTTLWQNVDATTLFPATINDTSSGVPWDRVSIAPPASCASAELNHLLDGDQCVAVLRGTYVDRARSMAAVVAVVVSDGDATQIDVGLGGEAVSGDYQMAVRATPVPGTAAADLRDADLIGISSWASSSGSGPVMQDYTVVTETGSLDGRTAGQLPGPWADEPGGTKRDLDGWLVPATQLAKTYGTYLTARL